MTKLSITRFHLVLYSSSIPPSFSSRPSTPIEECDIHRWSEIWPLTVQYRISTSCLQICCGGRTARLLSLSFVAPVNKGKLLFLICAGSRNTRISMIGNTKLNVPCRPPEHSISRSISTTSPSSSDTIKPAVWLGKRKSFFAHFAHTSDYLKHWYWNINTRNIKLYSRSRRLARSIPFSLGPIPRPYSRTPRILLRQYGLRAFHAQLGSKWRRDNFLLPLSMRLSSSLS